MKRAVPFRTSYAITVLTIICLLPMTHRAETQSDTLSNRIGRMVMVGFRGESVNADDPIAQQIRDGHVGGVILYARDVPSESAQRNISSPDQVRKLVRQLQSFSDRRLLIAIDQEGGQVQRLAPRHGFDSYPSHEKLGKSNTTERTRTVARQIASELHKLGINVNFAPVVDLNLNPDNPVIGKIERSFGADPTHVTKHARAFVNAHQNQNVLPVLKHFPGHGSSKKDTHKGFVDVSDVWKKKELQPYRNLLPDQHPVGVMTAHLFHRSWDKNWPATLSSHVVRDRLRNQIGHEGLVFSDDLQMGAIRKQYDRSTVLKRSIQAGIDVLLLSNNSTYKPHLATRTVNQIQTLVKRGDIRKEHILRSARRIDRTLSKLSDND